MRGKVSIINVTIEGLRAMYFKAVRPHFSDGAFRLNIDNYVPIVDAEGIYDAYGILAGFRFNGKGTK